MDTNRKRNTFFFSFYRRALIVQMCARSFGEWVNVTAPGSMATMESAPPPLLSGVTAAQAFTCHRSSLIIHSHQPGITVWT